MSSTVNRTGQLVEAHTKSRFGQKAALQAAGTELPQHNVKAKAKKAAAKKASVKKTAAKKASATKATAKKAAAKSTAKKS
jgi:ribonuclease E